MCSSDLLIDPTLRRQFQTLPLRAVAERSTTIAWIVDGRSIGASESDAALEWPLEAGRHVIIARDEFGHRAEASIVVK